MNELKLTKDADKMICLLYKEYLERRKRDIDKSDAKYFADGWQAEFFPKQSESDMDETARELAETLECKLDIVGGFTLEKNAVIYMENRFPLGLSELLKYLAQIAPTLVSTLLP